MRGSRWTRILFIVVFVGVLAAALTAVNLRFTRSNAGGNDFLPRWLGTRLFLTEGYSPYSAETTAAIQSAMYGRTANEAEDLALFAYPLYSMLIFAPFSLVSDYPLARALWITVLEISLMGSALATLALSGWKPSRWVLAAFFFFSLAWFHSAKPLVDGNAAILVASLASLALLAVQRKEDGLGGMLMALSTIKPHLVAPLILFVLLWAIAKRRRGIFWSFVVTLGVLAGVSFIIDRGWLFADIAQVLVYDTYTPPSTPVGIFSEWWGRGGRVAGVVFSLVFALLLLYEWWVALDSDSDRFLWVACLTLVVSPLAGMPTTSSNYALLLPALALVSAQWQQRLGTQTAAWFNMAVLFIGIWALFLLTLNPGEGQYREHLSLFFAAPIFLFLNLYWLRWWLRGQRPARRTA
jgi:hypothetical protein